MQISSPWCTRNYSSLLSSASASLVGTSQCSPQPGDTRVTLLSQGTGGHHRCPSWISQNPAKFAKSTAAPVLRERLPTKIHPEAGCWLWIRAPHCTPVLVPSFPTSPWEISAKNISAWKKKHKKTALLGCSPARESYRRTELSCPAVSEHHKHPSRS